MNGIKCCDDSGAILKHIYQWDTEQVVKICGVDASIDLEVQFCSIDSEEALVVRHSVNGTDVIADIPNILLQRPVPIMVYVCHSSSNGASRTIGAARITVVPKAKPTDYIYAETEVLSYRTLDAQMSEIRNSLASLEDKIPVALPNPYPLTINGQSYDGSGPVDINMESNTQGGGTVSVEAIKLAVDAYMTEHPVNFEETDPTVPEWAKHPNKPSYTAQEVGALPADTFIPVLPDTSEIGQRAWVKHKEIVTTEETWGVTVDMSDGGVLPSFNEIKMHITFPDTSGGTSLNIQFSSNAGLIFKATYTNAVAASKQTRFYGHASNDGSFVSGYIQNDWDFIPLKARMYAPFDAGSVKSIVVNPTAQKLAVGVLIEIWGR